MQKNVPIFPLNIVLFPGSKYGLHIFEERYKKMIMRCLTNKELFGIVTGDDSVYSKVGCLCRIENIKKEYPDGRKDIIVEGMYRFFIQSSHQHNDGYLEADYTEYVDLPDAKIDISKTEQAKSKFEKIVEKTAMVLEQAYWDKLEKTRLKSYKIAEKSGLNLQQQQELLISKSENTRLNILIEHFEKIEKYFDYQSQINKLIENDGYLN